MKTITLHALSPKAPHTIHTAQITDIVETRFGGCGILFAGKVHPEHFWESREQVLQMLVPAATPQI